MTKITMKAYSYDKIRNAMRSIPMGLNAEVSLKKLGQKGCFDLYGIEIRTRNSVTSLDAFEAFRTNYTGKIEMPTLWTTPKKSYPVEMAA